MAEDQEKKPGTPPEPQELKEEQDDDVDLGGWKPVRIVPGDKEATAGKEAGESKEEKPAEPPAKPADKAPLLAPEKPKLQLREEKPMRVEPNGAGIAVPPPPPEPPPAEPAPPPAAGLGGGGGPMRIEPDMNAPPLEMGGEPPPLGIPPLDATGELEVPGMELEQPAGKLPKILFIVTVVFLLMSLGVMIMPALDKPLPSVFAPLVGMFRSVGGAP